MDNPHAQPPTILHHFHRLAAERQRTAAATVPLVIYQDTLSAGNEAQANCHQDFFSLYFVRQGRGTHYIDGVPYGVSRGDVYAMGLGMTHWFAGRENLQSDTLHFALEIFEPVTLNALSETPGFQPLFVEEPLRRGKERKEKMHQEKEQGGGRAAGCV